MGEGHVPDQVRVGPPQAVCSKSSYSLKITLLQSNPLSPLSTIFLLDFPHTSPVKIITFAIIASYNCKVTMAKKRTLRPYDAPRYWVADTDTETSHRYPDVDQLDQRLGASRSPQFERRYERLQIHLLAVRLRGTETG